MATNFEKRLQIEKKRRLSLKFGRVLAHLTQGKDHLNSICLCFFDASLPQRWLWTAPLLRVSPPPLQRATRRKFFKGSPRTSVLPSFLQRPSPLQYGRQHRRRGCPYIMTYYMDDKFRYFISYTYRESSFSFDFISTAPSSVIAS